VRSDDVAAMEQSGGIAGTVSAPTRTEESKLRNGKTVEQSGKKEAFHMHHGKPQCRGGCVPGMLLPAYGVEIWKRRRMITHITSRTPRFHASGGPSPPQAADCYDELIANLAAVLCSSRALAHQTPKRRPSLLSSR
jgi:hypothetical protein